MTRIGLIVSSTRPNRFADHPANWMLALAEKRNDMQAELLDLRDYPMPLFDETASPAYTPSKSEVARRWQEKIAGFDGYVVITAEYNHGPTAAIKNALDYAFKEWNNKPIGFVGYGSAGGARAVEQLRLVAVELQMAPIRNAVHIQWPIYMAVAQEGKTLDSFDFLQDGATAMLDQLVWWANALKAAREGASTGKLEKAD